MNDSLVRAQTLVDAAETGDWYEMGEHGVHTDRIIAMALVKATMAVAQELHAMNVSSGIVEP